MVSLISVFNKQRQQILLSNLMENMYDHVLFTMGDYSIVFTTVLKNKLVTFHLYKRRFNVLLTERMGKHVKVFSYKTVKHSPQCFYQGVKRFLSVILDINVTDNSRQVKKTFTYMISRAAAIADIPEYYLLIVEKLAIARWKQEQERRLISWSIL